MADGRCVQLARLAPRLVSALVAGRGPAHRRPVPPPALGSQPASRCFPPERRDSLGCGRAGDASTAADSHAPPLGRGGDPERSSATAGPDATVYSMPYCPTHADTWGDRSPTGRAARPQGYPPVGRGPPASRCRASGHPRIRPVGRRPGSPTIPTTCPRPVLACAQRSSKLASSRALPTNRLKGRPRASSGEALGTGPTTVCTVLRSDGSGHSARSRSSRTHHPSTAARAPQMPESPRRRSARGGAPAAATTESIGCASRPMTVMEGSVQAVHRSARRMTIVRLPATMMAKTIMPCSRSCRRQGSVGRPPC
jgi:hypothetical protein